MFNRGINPRNFLGLVGLIVIFSVPAWAQSQEIFPRAEVFLGYSYSSLDPSRNTDRINSNGWETSFSGNFNRHFGLTADISGHYGSTDRAFGQTIASVNIRSHEFLFGPRATVRAKNVTAFGHALAGWAHLTRGGFNFNIADGVLRSFPCFK